MKRILITIFFAFSVIHIQAQITVRPASEISEAVQARLSLTLDAPEIKLPSMDYSAMEEKSLETRQGEPFRFGMAHNIKLGLNDGKWYEDDFGQKIYWKLKISSPSAYSINLIFDQLELPLGVELFLVSGHGPH